MKRNLLLLLLLAPIFLFAQEQRMLIGIDGKWKQIGDLNIIKNYEQTLPILADIKATAKRNNLRDTYIRAILAETRGLTINRTNEQAFELIQKHFERSILEGDTIQRSIIKNFYALFLLSNSNLFLPNSSNSFIKGTSAEKRQLIDVLFRESLIPSNLLQKEPSRQWSDLFEEHRSTNLMPTIYHLLAYEYLNFLENNPADSLGQYDKLKKEILAVNKEKGYAEATSYLLSNKLLSNTWNLTSHVAELTAIMDRHPSAYNAYILSKLGESFVQRGDRKEGIKYIDQVLRDYPKSIWLPEAEKIEKQIKATTVDVEHDLHIPKKNYLPISLNTRNADSLFIKVFRTTNTVKSPYYRTFKVAYDSTTHETRLDAPLVYEETVALQKFDDFQNHRSIYKINPLDYGQYTILFSNNAAFKDDGLYKEVASSSFTVTDVLVSARQDEETDDDKGYRVLLINRNSGKPYANKKVTLYETNPKRKAEKIQRLNTTKAGELTYRTSERKDRDELNYYDLLLPTENQLVSLFDLEIPDYYNDEEEIADELEGEETAITLTDRAIYRPGQKVHFKTILYNNSLANGRIIENKSIAVYLHDANGQKVDSLHAETNLFGSVNGILQIPSKTLNGGFSLKVFVDKQESQVAYFRVEEYKRPTFKVNFETNKETYKLRDTAVFTGNAESFAGVPIALANVQYKVEFYGRSGNYLQKLLLDTLTQTDQQGKFQLRIPLNDSSMFRYTDFSLSYVAEVTSPSGEMQSANGNYVYADKPWNIQIISTPYIAEKEWSKLEIKTSNPNGQPLKFAGNVRVYKIEEPKITIPTRLSGYFNSVDYHLLSSADYKTYFPNQFDELLLAKEEQKTLIETYDFDSNESNMVNLDSNLFSKGKYLIEAFSIQGSDTIRGTAYTQVYDPISRRVSAKEFLSYALDSASYAVGDQVNVRFETDLDQAEQLFIFQSRGGKTGAAISLPIQNGKAVYSFTLKDQDFVFPLQLSALIVNNNMAELRTIRIPLKQKDKSLSIQTLTFRDKITPGQPERWRFKIKHGENAVPSEVAASMYDISLDEFAAHSFPSSFGRIASYRYYQQPFNYLLNDFYHKTNSYSIYRGKFDYASLYAELPVVRSYNLWYTAGGYLRRSYSKALQTSLDEVVVAYEPPQEGQRLMIRGAASISDVQPLLVVDGEVQESSDISQISANDIESINVLKDASATALYGSRGAAGVIIITTKEGAKTQYQLNAVKARANLQETAFFLPTLYTDEQGDISVELNSPEALTKWKLLLFAHGKNLEAGTNTFFTQTQKELMVSPNMPRYFHENDELVLKATIQNLSEHALDGNAQLEFINPENNEVISARFLDKPTQSFSVDQKNNVTVSWSIKIPMGFPTVQVKIVAATAEFSDGEMHELAILPNRVLVSETTPIFLQDKETKHYTLKTANKENLQARLQIQSNPILEVIGALDYLKSYPYECTEQLSSKWFALKMVQYIQKHYPAIASYFNALQAKQTESKLSENSKLSELTAEEMPWIRNIKHDEEKLQALSKLFDSNNTFEINEIEKKLRAQQLKTGAFPWFEGGRANTPISIRLLEIWGKVLKLDKDLVSADMRQIARKLTQYLDQDSSIFDKKSNMTTVLDYLFSRHYWQGLYPLDVEQQAMLNYKLSQSAIVTANLSAGEAAKSWMVNLLFGNAKQAEQIRNRLRQEAIHDSLKGIYWESNEHRYDAVSLQSYMVEAYKLNDPSQLKAITQWVYYHKQASHWRTTWMTVDAIYALLLTNNPSEFAVENNIAVFVDQQSLAVEPASLGQVAKVFPRETLDKNLEMDIRNNNDRSVYGYLNHQYFAKETELPALINNLSISKQYLVERDGKWSVTSSAKLGEKIKVRLTVIAGAAFSNLHLKDSRPAGAEPIYQPSGYKWWQGYYFSMKDASTNYFFDRLSKGKHVYEYEVKANNVGVFQSGISTIGSMYDPSVNARAANTQLEIIE